MTSFNNTYHNQSGSIHYITLSSPPPPPVLGLDQRCSSTPPAPTSVSTFHPGVTEAHMWMRTHGCPRALPHIGDAPAARLAAGVGGGGGQRSELLAAALHPSAACES